MSQLASYNAPLTPAFFNAYENLGVGCFLTLGRNDMSGFYPDRLLIKIESATLIKESSWNFKIIHERMDSAVGMVDIDCYNGRVDPVQSFIIGAFILHQKFNGRSIPYASEYSAYTSGVSSFCSFRSTMPFSGAVSSISNSTFLGAYYHFSDFSS